MALYIETPERFGAAVKYLRLKRGWSQRTLASRAGVSLQLISKVEHLRVAPKLSTIIRLTEAFGLSLVIAPPQQHKGEA